MLAIVESSIYNKNMGKFFNKFFSNPNKLLNITCAVLSILVFVLGIFSVVASIFGQTYTGSSNQLTITDSELTNDNYVTEGSTTTREKISFTKESDGSYGITAFNEVLNFLTEEKKRVVTEGGVETEANGTVYAKAMGIDVVQSMTMIQNQDSFGNIFYEELAKEVSSTGFGPESSLRAYISNGNARYQFTESAKLSGSKVVGVYSGSVKEKPEKNFLNENASFDVHPLGFTTDVSIIELDSCVLEESFLGFNFTYNVKLNGNYFVTEYQTRLGAAAGAVKNTTKLSKSQYTISFNKYGQIMSFDSSYAFDFVRNSPRTEASTNGNLKTIVKYKNENYTVTKI